MGNMNVKSMAGLEHYDTGVMECWSNEKMQYSNTPILQTRKKYP
jgi:hypothetical protein